MSKSGLNTTVRNATDEEQIRQARSNEEIVAYDEVADAAMVMSTPHGKRFVAKYLRRTGVFEDSFHVDPIVHARFAGMRLIGLQLLEDIKRADPNILLDIIQDYMEKEEGVNVIRRRSRTRRKRRKPGTSNGNGAGGE